MGGVGGVGGVGGTRYTLAEIVGKYVAIRDKKDEIKKRHQKELAPVNLVLDQLESLMLGELNRQGAKSIATPNGTAYRTKRTSAVVEDWAECLLWIIGNQAWDLLEARVSKTGLEAMLEDLAKRPGLDPEDRVVPGVRFAAEAEVNVRRPG